MEITLIFNNDTIENRQHYSCYNESYFKIGTNRAEINVMISCNYERLSKVLIHTVQKIYYKMETLLFHFNQNVVFR